MSHYAHHTVKGGEPKGCRLYDGISSSSGNTGEAYLPTH